MMLPIPRGELIYLEQQPELIANSGVARVQAEECMLPRRQIVHLQHHVTWSINSVCHFFGKRRFEVEDESTNVFWLAIPSLGEAWHHNHHAFPRSARHGLKWYEIDLSAALIALLQKLGLAWNVTKIAPERQAQKLAGATREPVVSS